MISPKVHIPRQSPIPTCVKTATNSTKGRQSGFQMSTQKDISQSTQTYVITFKSQGFQASQVMSADWYSRFANARHIASPFHHAVPCNFEIPAKK